MPHSAPERGSSGDFGGEKGDFVKSMSPYPSPIADNPKYTFWLCLASDLTPRCDRMGASFFGVNGDLSMFDSLMASATCRPSVSKG